MPALLAQADALKNQPVEREPLCHILESAEDLNSAQTLEKIKTLRHPGSVVVVAGFYPGLFGGEAYQMMKCLTAIKVCEELERHDVAAIPVCWIDTSPSADFAKRSLQLLDSESELHCRHLELPAAKDFSPCDPLPSDQISGLIAEIEELGKGSYDPEILQILKDAFNRKTTFANASARLIASLLEEWGMIVIDSHSLELQSLADHAMQTLPRSLIQNAVLPVLAAVIDPYEIDLHAGRQQAFESSGRIQPMAWPQASATIIDARSRRTLDRYDLNLPRLYGGWEALAGRFADAMPRGASEKLLSLRQEVEERIDRLKVLGPAESDFGKEADSAREKILFQLDRVRTNFDAACQRKRETVGRHIRRACNALAPNGRIQERELAGIYLPLRHSRAALRSLYERLDILSLEHQLIFMD